jgi:hypothetical protein
LDCSSRLDRATYPDRRIAQAITLVFAKFTEMQFPLFEMNTGGRRDSEARFPYCPRWLLKRERFRARIKKWQKRQQRSGECTRRLCLRISSEVDHRRGRPTADETATLSAIQREPFGRHPRVPKGTIKYSPTVPKSALDRDRDTVEACRLVLGMRCSRGIKTCTWSRDSTRDLQVDPIAPPGAVGGHLRLSP